MSDFVPLAAGATVLRQVCVPFSLNDIFRDDDGAPADARSVGVDARSHDVRVSRDAIGGHRRLVTNDVVRVLNRSSPHAASQYVSLLKRNVELWEELKPFMLYVQFSGHGVKALLTLTLEGTYILMLKLPGDVGMGLRRSAADAMMRIAAGDPRLAETLRANARFSDLFTEVAREAVAAADAAADGGAPVQPPPGDGNNNGVADDDLDRKERELKLRRENVGIAKQEMALRVETATAEAAVRVKTAAAEAAVRVKTATAEAAARVKAATAEAKAHMAEADGKAAAMKTITNEEIATLRRMDDAEHRSRKRRHQDEESHIARQILLNLPQKVAELRAALRIPDTPAGQKQVDEQIALWRMFAALPASVGQQQQEEHGEAPEEEEFVVPPAPVGPNDGVPGAFTLRGYVNAHKSLAQVPTDKRAGVLLSAGRLLAQACKAQGIALPAKTNEGGQAVRLYPPAAAAHARDVLAKLVRDLQKQPNIGHFFGQRSDDGAFASAGAAAEADD